MIRLLSLIWSLVATVLAGLFVLAVLTVPALSSKEMMLILPAAILGAVLAIPVSVVVTKKILAATGGK